MGDEQLSTFQAAQLKWLKRQVDNLQDEKGRSERTTRNRTRVVCGNGRVR